MEKEKLELLQGTLDMLILKSLVIGQNHGYGIAQWIRQSSENVLSVEEGSLYPALRRLEQRELIASTWGISDNNRRARFYEITPTGRAYLTEETSRWEVMREAISRVLQTA
ncbi:MAG TPA: PadR family transcriptional regulator [Acidobacteriota bacterium]|nr:PadR family transcriptional regulator [Acidobacteriota bacterium]HND22234.1 PadR family transcriptional regulator [Acidobacteriota bacterium]HNG94266.1 PadR family transcriptional regulator [Acidobacteriota bacterium]HNH84659.1 PadR family transcriptional regulator [Acidobacteriota bacterium]HNJ42566.1 PadR family transcriptional regulator [Acidobacteriota bacterium]